MCVSAVKLGGERDAPRVLARGPLAPHVEADGRVPAEVATQRWAGGQVGRWGGGEVGRWAGGQVGRWAAEYVGMRVGVRRRWLGAHISERPESCAIIHRRVRDLPLVDDLVPRIHARKHLARSALR